MTGKDLLEGLSFLDEKLIEEMSREEKKPETGTGVTDIQTEADDGGTDIDGKDCNVIYRIRIRTRRRKMRKAIAAAAAGMVVFLGGAAAGHMMNWGRKAGNETAMLAYPENADGNEDEYTAEGTMTEQNMISVLSEDPSADSMSQLPVVYDGSSVRIKLQNIIINQGVPYIPDSGETGVMANTLDETEVYFYEQDQFTAIFQQNGVTYQITASDLKETVRAAAETIYKGWTVIIE